MTRRRAEETIARALALAQELPEPGFAATRPVASFAGGHGVRRAGTGESFWQFREYAPGDPARMIDWRRSARTDGVFIREKEQQSPRTFYMRGDRSPSMDYASSRALPSKRDYADLLLLALSARLLRAGERIALLDAERGAFTGFGAFADLASLYLEEGRAEAMGEGVKPGCGIFLFGDFLSSPDDLARALGRLGDDLIGDIVWVLDPAERDFPFQGHTRFLDAEGGPDFVAADAVSLKAEYRALLAAHGRALESIATGRGLGFHAVSTTDDPVGVLRRLQPFHEEGPA